MADDDKEVIKIHNERDEKDGVFIGTLKSSAEGLWDMGKGFIDTVGKAAERLGEENAKFRDKTGFYVGEDMDTMTPECIAERIGESDEKSNKATNDDSKSTDSESTDEEAANKKRLEELQKEYIVSGARITCSKCAMGEQPMDISYVVVPTSHGVYIHGLAQLNIKDCTPENIKKFKFCTSKENPKVLEAAKEVLQSALENRKKGFFDRAMDLMTRSTDEVKVDVDAKEGLADYCAGECIFENKGEWKDGKSDVLIDGTEALLGKCKLQCKYGGEIKLYSNGLENAKE